MIREITEDEITVHFFDLMGEVECGNRFKRDDPSHVAWLRDRVRLRLAQGARFYGLFSDVAEPIGFYALVIEKGPAGIPFMGQKAEILDIGVLKELRSMGHGSRLVEHAESLARESGAYCLYAATYAGSDRAVSFYVRNGLCPVATLPDVLGPGVEGIVHMRKLLR